MASSKEQTTSALHPIFYQCCGERNGRYEISHPFRYDGYIYATDGHTAVRTRDRGQDVPNLERVPPMETLDWQVDIYQPEPFAWPRLPESSIVTCEECQGFGEVTCNMGHEHECPCCGGATEIGHQRVLDFGAFALKEKRVRMLVSYGARLYLHRARPDRRPARFTIGDDIEGLVMVADPGSAPDDVVRVPQQAEVKHGSE